MITSKEELQKTLAVLGTNQDAINNLTLKFGLQAETQFEAINVVYNELAKCLFDVDKNLRFAKEALTNLANTGKTDLITKSGILYNNAADLVKQIDVNKNLVQQKCVSSEDLINKSRILCNDCKTFDKTKNTPEAAKARCLAVLDIATSLTTHYNSAKSISDSALTKVASLNGTCTELFVIEAEIFGANSVMAKVLDGKALVGDIAADFQKAQTLYEGKLYELAKSSPLADILFADIKFMRKNSWLSMSGTYSSPKDSETIKDILIRLSEKLCTDIMNHSFDDVNKITDADAQNMAMLSGGEFDIISVENKINSLRSGGAVTLFTVPAPLKSVLEIVTSSNPISQTYDRVANPSAATETPASQLSNLQRERLNALIAEKNALKQAEDSATKEALLAKNKLEEAEAKAKLLEATLLEKNKADLDKQLKIAENLETKDDQIKKLQKELEESKNKEIIPSVTQNDVNKVVDQAKDLVKDAELKILGMKPLVAAGVGAGAALLLIMLLKKSDK